MDVMAIIKAMYPFAHIPSENWSLCNRLLMVIAGTIDARGYGQWKEADRYVKKGTKAIYIVVPYIKHKEIDDEETNRITGFGLQPVPKPCVPSLCRELRRKLCRSGNRLLFSVSVEHDDNSAQKLCSVNGFHTDGKPFCWQRSEHYLLA